MNLNSIQHLFLFLHYGFISFEKKLSLSLCELGSCKYYLISHFSTLNLILLLGDLQQNVTTL